MHVNNKKSAVNKTYFILLSFKAFVCALLLSGTVVANVPPIDDGTPSGICNSGDLISGSGFEDLPNFEIRFTGNSSAMFTDTGQQAEFEVTYVNDQGQPVDTSTLEWCLEDDSLLEISPSGTSATVTSTGFDITSVDVIVRDPVTHASARGLIYFADLQDNAFIIEDTLVINGVTPPPGETGTIRLVRNAFSESLIVGQVFATDAELGILVKILGITIGPDYIDFEVEQATLEELFANLDIDTESTTTNLRVFTEPDGQATLAQVNDQGQAIETLAVGDWTCSSSSVDIKAFFPTVTFDIKRKTGVIFKISGFSVKKFGITSKGEGKVTGSWGSELKVEIAPKTMCEIEFGTISGPGILIGPILIGAGVSPKLGFEIKVTIPTLSVALIEPPKMEGVAKWDMGFIWDSVSGLDNVNEFESNFKMVKNASPKDEAETSITFKPYAGANVDLTFWKWPVFSFLKLEFGFPYQLDWSGPFDYTHKDYLGPTWTFSQLFEIKWDTAFGEGLGDILDVVIRNNSFNLDTATPLYSYQDILVSSPKPMLDLTCDPSTCYLDPVLGDFLNYHLYTEDAYWFIDQGKADLVGWKDDAVNSQVLVADKLFTAGNSRGLWAPDVPDEGQWKVSGLLWDIDPVSLWRPYLATSAKDVEVGPSSLITVMKVDGNGNMAPGGKVLSTPAVIDCGDTCEGYFKMDSEVTLTASNAGGWNFVEWDSSSQVCPRATDPVCTVASVDSDKIAKAVFEESFNYTLVIAYGRTSYEDLKTFDEVEAGENLTVGNGLRYHVGLKLDGQPVDYYRNGYAGTDFWIYDSFPKIDYGSNDQQFANFEFTGLDATNNRTVNIPINLTVSNQGYRNIAGRTFTLMDAGGGYIIDGSTMTFEPFAEGTQSGKAIYTTPDDSTIETTWYEYFTTANGHFNCADGERDSALLGGFKTQLYLGGQSFYHVMADHVYIQNTYHFCPERADRRIVHGDH